MRNVLHGGPASRWVAVAGLATLMAGSACGTSRDGDAPATAVDPAPGITSPATSETTPAPGAVPAIVDLAGRYTIEDGSNADGSGGYAGEVAISRNGDVHRLSWTIPGSPAQSGLALIEGDVLATGYGTGRAYGVAVYRISSGGAMAGRWADASAGAQPGTEDLAGPDGLNGRYESVGRRPDGTSYTGTVEIEPTGKTYAISRSLPDGRYSGVGIRTGDLLVVGWGEAPGAVAYKVDGPTLRGLWAILGDTAVGSESLVRKP